MAWRKWLLIGLVAVVTVCLLVVGIAAWKNREFAPGTLPEVAQIPTHDRKLEGQTVTVSLAKMAKAAGEELPFAYVWQPESETGYLVCFDLREDAVTEGTVYQPQWQGLEGLCGATQEAFSATVVRQLNISAQEGHYMRGVTAFSREYHEKLLSEEVVDIYNVQESSQGSTRVYLGMLMNKAPQGHYATRREDGSYVEIMEKSHYTPVEGSYLYLTGNAVVAASEQLQEQIAVFYRIMERFGVEEVLATKEDASQPAEETDSQNETTQPTEPLTEKDYYTPPKNLRVQIYKPHEQYYYLRRYGVDTVHCKKRGLYVFNCETKEIVAICNEPVAMASANYFGVFYVTQADSGTIIHATLDGQKKTAVYKGKNITHIDAFGGKEEKLGVVEDKTDVYVYDPVLGTKTLVYSHSGIETVSFDMGDQGLWLEVRTSSSGWLYHPETKQTHYLPEYSD